MTDAAWTVYILQCADGTLYTGITNDLARRVGEHEAGTGAKYTRGRAPLTLVHSESVNTRGEALRREAAIKALSRNGKLRLIRR